jgi:hypothetical protein
VTELSHAKRNSIAAVALAALNVWPSEAETIDIIDDHGGLTHQLIWMRTPEVYRFLHRRDEAPPATLPSRS